MAIQLDHIHLPMSRKKPEAPPMYAIECVSANKAIEILEESARRLVAIYGKSQGETVINHILEPILAEDG